MLKHYINPDRNILIYDHHEALTAAGTSEYDPGIHQDQALEEFFEGRRVQHLLWDLDTYDQQFKQAVSEGVEVLIVKKEKP